MNIFSGLPVAVTSPVLFIALALVAIGLFLLLNGRSVRVRAHSPLLIVLVLAAAWFFPHALYAIGRVAPHSYATTVRVIESRKFSSGRASMWTLSVREPNHAGSYDFMLAGPREFRDVDLATVAAGSCLAVSGVRPPGAVLLYDAAPAICP